MKIYITNDFYLGLSMIGRMNIITLTDTIATAIVTVRPRLGNCLPNTLISL